MLTSLQQKKVYGKTGRRLKRLKHLELHEQHALSHMKFSLYYVIKICKSYTKI